MTGNEYRFDPGELRVAPAESVTIEFSNAGQVPHTLTMPVAHADTGSVAPGTSATLSFSAPSQAGQYEFLCSFGGHPEAGMVGLLIVE